MGPDDGRRSGAGAWHVDGRPSGLSDVGLGDQQSLVFVVEALALLGQFGLELGLGGGFGVAFLLQLRELEVTCGGSIETFLGEGGGLGGEGLVDPLLDGVNFVRLGLTIMSSGGGGIQTALADGGSQVGDNTGGGDLVVDEGADGASSL